MAVIMTMTQMIMMMRVMMVMTMAMPMTMLKEKRRRKEEEDAPLPPPPHPPTMVSIGMIMMIRTEICALDISVRERQTPPRSLSGMSLARPGRVRESLRKREECSRVDWMGSGVTDWHSGRVLE
eukprot:1878264-Pyramimonas_sp.AAC.1